MQGRHLWPFPYVFISRGVLWSKCMKLNIKLVVWLRGFWTDLRVSAVLDTASVPFPLLFSHWPLTLQPGRFVLGRTVWCWLEEGRVGGGGCGALALPQVARGFYPHGPHWKTGPQPWHNSPQVFDSTKLLRLLPSQLLLNPCGCLGVPLVLLCLTCFVLCSVKILITWEGDWRKNIVLALNNTSFWACSMMTVFFDFYFLICCRLSLLVPFLEPADLVWGVDFMSPQPVCVQTGGSQTWTN